MRYKLLGKSGLRVSEVCLGTMMMSTESPSSAGPEESRRILEAYEIARKVDEIADRLGQLASGGMLDAIDNEHFPT